MVADEESCAPIDYEAVYEVLEAEMDRSMKWLRQALDSELKL